jgi:exodeoxyribonuclease VII small subunit
MAAAKKSSKSSTSSKSAKASKKVKTTPANAEVEVPFETALEKLEEAVADLEGGELGIDDALAKYEDGITQLRRCQQILKRAEQKVELLLRGADGELSTSPASDSDTDGSDDGDGDGE